MIFEVEETSSVENLFGDWQETLIWSCLQKVMGRVYADDLQDPRSSMAILGDFAFFAGKPCKELVLYKPNWFTQNFIIMVPQNDEWAELIEDSYGDKAKKVIRYAMKKEVDNFDVNKLQAIVNSLEEKYTIQLIDEGIFQYCKLNSWSKDLVSQFHDYAMYEKLGLGVVIIKDGEPVSGAASYSRYKDGIEIEIDTKEEYRRKGLAAACGAKLILECLARDLYPSWDAQNKWSVALAEKLGYHYDYDYVAFEKWGQA
jgi:GNAT superfamily N-acetyltransferase